MKRFSCDHDGYALKTQRICFNFEKYFGISFFEVLFRNFFYTRCALCVIERKECFESFLTFSKVQKSNVWWKKLSVNKNLQAFRQTPKISWNLFFFSTKINSRDCHISVEYILSITRFKFRKRSEDLANYQTIKNRLEPSLIFVATSIITQQNWSKSFSHFLSLHWPTFSFCYCGRNCKSHNSLSIVQKNQQKRISDCCNCNFETKTVFSGSLTALKCLSSLVRPVDFEHHVIPQKRELFLWSIKNSISLRYQFAKPYHTRHVTWLLHLWLLNHIKKISKWFSFVFHGECKTFSFKSFPYIKKKEIQ